MVSFEKETILPPDQVKFVTMASVNVVLTKVDLVSSCPLYS